MAAPAVASVSTVSNNSASTSYVGNAPASLANGDVLYAHIGWRGATNITTPPSDWTAVSFSFTQAGSTCGQAVYRKVITNAGGEPSQYTWTGDTSVASIVRIYRVTGADTTTTVEAHSSEDETANINQTTVPALTTLGADRLLLGFAVESVTVTLSTASSGWTKDYNDSGGGGASVFTVAGFQRTQAAQGSSGSLVIDSTGSSFWIAGMISIPAAATTPAQPDRHVGNDIPVDETTTNTPIATNALPATSAYGLITRRKTIEEVEVPATYYNQALAGATGSEALASLTPMENWAEAAAATTRLVPTGKTLRLTGITGIARRVTGTGSLFWDLKLYIRVNTGGTATLTSPVVFAGSTVWNEDVTRSTTTQFGSLPWFVDIPGGIEIPSGASWALGYIDATSAQPSRVENAVAIHGFLY